MNESLVRVSNDDFGSYMTGFFTIGLDIGLTEGDLFEQLRGEDLATFVHEYIHFLQDITTTSGLSVFNWLAKSIQADIYETFHSEESIEVPRISGVENADAETQLQVFYRGDNEYRKIHHISEIIEEPEDCLDEYVHDKITKISIYYDDKETPYVFGNECIKESIAYLIESEKFHAQPRKHEIPYNACEMFCEYMYPELAKRKDVIVLLAELSLRHYHSGLEFYKFVLDMKKNQRADLDISKIRDIYLQKVAFLDKNYEERLRETRDSIDFLYPANTLFSEVNKWLKRAIKEAQNYRDTYAVPISQFMGFDNNQRDKYLRQLLYDIGMPLIRNRNQECFSLGETDLSYLLVPIAVYDAFGGKGKCFMYESCQVHQHPCLDKNCFRSPWKQVEKERLCPFAAFWYHYSLSGKEIKYKSWLKNN